MAPKYLAINIFFYGKPQLFVIKNDVQHQDIKLSENINKHIAPEAFTLLRCSIVGMYLDSILVMNVQHLNR